MQSTIDIDLGSDGKLLAQLFSFTTEKTAAGLTILETFIGHFINQTLQRDGLFGAWAKVWLINGNYNLKISSPHHDLSRYAKSTLTLSKRENWPCKSSNKINPSSTM
jgi:hypothetical protein